MMGGQPNSGVVALDPKTGTTIWESVGKQNWQGQPMTGWRGSRTVAWQNQWKQASFSSLITAEIHGKPHLIALMRQGLVSLDPDSGKVNFSRWFRATVNDSVNGSTPVIVDNYIFISNAYYNTAPVLRKSGRAVHWKPIGTHRFTTRAPFTHPQEGRKNKALFVVSNSVQEN